MSKLNNEISRYRDIHLFVSLRLYCHFCIGFIAFIWRLRLNLSLLKPLGGIHSKTRHLFFPCCCGDILYLLWVCFIFGKNLRNRPSDVLVNRS